MNDIDKRSNQVVKQHHKMLRSKYGIKAEKAQKNISKDAKKHRKKKKESYANVEASPPRHWSFKQKYEHHKLLRQRHF
jgi:hypothetical protein